LQYETIHQSVLLALKIGFRLKLRQIFQTTVELRNNEQHSL